MSKLRKNNNFFLLFRKIKKSWKVANLVRGEKISVPALMAFLTSTQLSGMYIIFILTENCVSKEHLEHKDCS